MIDQQNVVDVIFFSQTPSPFTILIVLHYFDIFLLPSYVLEVFLAVL